MSGYEFADAVKELLPLRHNFYPDNVYPALERASDTVPADVCRAAIEQAAYLKGSEGSVAHESLKKGEEDRIKILEEFLGAPKQDAA